MEMPPALPRDLLKTICCLKCTKYLYPPVGQCDQCRLTICPSCAENTTVCPRCSTKFLIVGNIPIDRILRRFRVPCPHQCCFVSGRPIAIRRHQDLCEHQIKYCPLKDAHNCSWSGTTKNQVVRHCREVHPQEIHHADSKVLTIAGFKRKLHQSYSFDVLFDAFNELFHTQWRVDQRKRVLMWQVWFNGERYRRNEFHFEVRVENPSNQCDVVTLKSRCDLVKTNETMLENFVSILIDDRLLGCCIGDDLLVKIRITIP